MGTLGYRYTPEQRARLVARHPPLRERFAAKIEFDLMGGCWLWTGAMVRSTGYGTIQENGRTRGIHRVSYELHHGPIPPGLQVCHRCDVRLCVNPEHLFLGTASDNAQDMHRKGRANIPVGEAHVGSKLTAAEIPTVLDRLNNGESCARIATDYGLTDCAINAIRRGKSWRHVTGPLVFAARHNITLHDPTEQVAA